MNRAQQVVYMEDGSFTDDFDALGLGIEEETGNYLYDIALVGDGDATATNRTVTNTATPQDAQAALRAYAGGVFLRTVGEGLTTASILCEADNPGATTPNNLALDGGNLVCTDGENTEIGD